ncbi:hypothetical protein D3C73_1129850 [compost metagenome]
MRHHFNKQQITEIVEQVLHALISTFAFLHKNFNRLKHTAYIIIDNRTGKLCELSGRNPSRHIQHLLVRYMTISKRSYLVQHAYGITHTAV